MLSLQGALLGGAVQGRLAELSVSLSHRQADSEAEPQAPLQGGAARLPVLPLASRTLSGTLAARRQSAPK